MGGWGFIMHAWLQSSYNRSSRPNNAGTTRGRRGCEHLRATVGLGEANLTSESCEASCIPERTKGGAKEPPPPSATPGCISSWGEAKQVLAVKTSNATATTAARKRYVWSSGLRLRRQSSKHSMHRLVVYPSPHAKIWECHTAEITKSKPQ